MTSRWRQIDGDAEAGTSYGEIRVREAAGALRLDSACGDITVERALASVGASTKYGQVSVHQAAGGSLDLATSYGKVEAGIREGTPAWLDLESSSGKVRNLLTPSDAPDDSDEPLRIRARTVLRRHRRPSRLSRPTSSPPTESRAMSTSVPAAISTAGLRKSYGDHVVLDGIDLSVPRGRSSRCSAPTAPARRRWSTSSPR